MPTFGLITEGATDQQVIQAVLDGFFDPEEIDTRPFLPVYDNTHKHQVESFSNWQLVLEYCASPKFAEAFPFVDYIVVQVDTDQCDDPKFGVSKHEEGKLLPPFEIAARVAAKLQEKIGDTVWNRFHERIIFAVAVDTIECWLLPLYAEGKDKAKLLNCMKVLNRALSKKDEHTINPQEKEPRLYAKLARPYSRKRVLTRHSGENPSFAIFIERLNAIFPAQTADALEVEVEVAQDGEVITENGNIESQEGRAD